MAWHLKVSFLKLLPLHRCHGCWLTVSGVANHCHGAESGLGHQRSAENWGPGAAAWFGRSSWALSKLRDCEFNQPESGDSSHQAQGHHSGDGSHQTLEWTLSDRGYLFSPGMWGGMRALLTQLESYPGREGERWLGRLPETPNSFLVTFCT